MPLIGLELSDAGILAAGGDPPQLLAVDEDSLESPGFALPEKKALITGKAARRRARLLPRQVLNRFWDPIGTDPIDPPLPAAGNQAEVACAHLAGVWSRLRRLGDALVAAVPASYDRTQLGLLLGMAQELGIPLEGFVSLPVAAALPGPEDVHLFVDAHLHRFEVSVLRAQGRLELAETAAITEKGLEGLHHLWAQAAAAEFVRLTRFDPFHSAETDQELYDRLPPALAELRSAPAATIAIRTGRHHFSAALTRAVLLDAAKPVYDELSAAVAEAAQRASGAAERTAVQISHRLARLPGLAERLRAIPNVRVVELPIGAAALALPALWPALAVEKPASGAAFFSRRPWNPATTPTPREGRADTPRPTHLVYRGLAYPLTDEPLTVGAAPPAAGRGIRIAAPSSGIDPVHCAVSLQDGRPVLTDLGAGGTFVNDRRVQGPVVLSAGDVIRLGNTAAVLTVVACLEPHEA